MKMVIAGIGETGYYLSQLLLNENHDVTIIEKNQKAYRNAREKLDVQVHLGDASDSLVLEPLVDEDTDFFLSLTNDDNANIVGAMIARKYGAKRAIVRVSNAANLLHPLFLDDPGVSVLNAEMSVAKDLTRLIGNPSADEIEFFANGKAEMVRFHVGKDAKICGQALKNIEVPRSWIFIATIRGGEFTIVSGDTAFEADDQVLVMGSPKRAKEIETLLGIQSTKVRRVILVGYNDISKSVAKTLGKRNIEVRLIEEDQNLAEEAAAELDDVLVLHGDGTSEDILDQAGIDQTDYFLVLTADDENNVLIALLAKEKRVRRVIALALKPQYKPIIEKIGIDTVVNPRSAMVDDIFRSIHHKDLSVINIFEGGKGQAMEFIAKNGCQALKKPIAKLKLPPQTLIGAIVRGDELIIPRGEDQVEIGDRLVVFTGRSMLSEVKKVFVGKD